MSTPSLTPVATGTISVFHTTPASRFQQAVDLQLRVNDVERRVQRLVRLLNEPGAALARLLNAKAQKEGASAQAVS